MHILAVNHGRCIRYIVSKSRNDFQAQWEKNRYAFDLSLVRKLENLVRSFFKNMYWKHFFPKFGWKLRLWTE